VASDETLRVDPAVMQGFAQALSGGAEALRARLAELDAQVGVVSAGEDLGSVVSTLTTALAGRSRMAGDDPAGRAFGRSYDS
jgi:uncharacterized protein YukE